MLLPVAKCRFIRNGLQMATQQLPATVERLESEFEVAGLEAADIKLISLRYSYVTFWFPVAEFRISMWPQAKSGLVVDLDLYRQARTSGIHLDNILVRDRSAGNQLDACQRSRQGATRMCARPRGPE
jgi:hypothetical protein